MFISRIVTLATLAALAACANAPPPGRPAPTGITANDGGGTAVVGTLPANAGTVAVRPTR